MPNLPPRRKLHNLVDIDGVVKHETEKAYLFAAADREVWLPKSQCEWDPTTKQMTMEEWLATEKELV